MFGPQVDPRLELNGRMRNMIHVEMADHQPKVNLQFDRAKKFSDTAPHAH